MVSNFGFCGVTSKNAHTLLPSIAQSKWIAELTMLLARSRGLPVTIFRPGYVTGDSTTGVMNVDDYLVRLLKGCIQLGKVCRAGVDDCAVA